MPELPEVETTLRGISPSISGQTVEKVVIRHPTLRWPIPANLSQHLQGQALARLTRRGKYLLLAFPKGTLIIHLGMSGSLRILQGTSVAKKHDHVDIHFKNNICLRYTDPRRFGAILFTQDLPHDHVLLKKIGPEPLTAAFNGNYLFNLSRKRQVNVKSFIMNGQVVAGVGNIYATEALFNAKIHPNVPADQVSKIQYVALAKAIKKILQQAIKQGGTTLKDFAQSDGKPGYFRIKLKAYARAGKPCIRCHCILESKVISQRSTVYCPHCQKK